jgi:hypothetical protein
MQQNLDMFNPTHPVTVAVGELKTPTLIPGINKLEDTAGKIAGPMLMVEIKNNGFENLKTEEQLQDLAKVAVDLAKAILQRCADEYTVATNQHQQPAKLFKL